MNNDFVELIISIVLLLIFVAFLVWIVVGFIDSVDDLVEYIYEQKVRRDVCLQNGYPDNQTTTNGDIYCIKGNDVILSTKLEK